jgi:phage-related protein
LYNPVDERGRVSWRFTGCTSQFPESARRRAGQQLALLQEGRDPYDWKPMPSVGAGVREIRIRDEHGIFRVIYVTKFAERIYVLHCFQKKTQKTSQADIALAAARYKELQKGQGR